MSVGLGSSSRFCSLFTIVGLAVRALVIAQIWSAAAVSANAAPGEGTVSVILVGATGNLAKKYLWQGLFNIHLEKKHRVYVFPGATKSAEIGQPLLDEVLEGNITASFPSAKSAFIKDRVHAYSQMRSSSTYAELGNAINDWAKTSGENEIGRLIYLSVPPKFYGSIAREIDTHLRPKDVSGGDGPWLRVIVEKPFGTDLASAQKLADELDSSLTPQEVLLVDHYMGKPGVTALRDFRLANPAYEKSLKSAAAGGQVKEVEIVMTETEDCDGRTGFYNDVGVVRDVMQNHLTMMAALLTMKMPFNPQTALLDERKERLDAIANLGKATASSAAEYGQYARYRAHAMDTETRTPTWAVVNLEFTEGDWKGVPLRMVSGKARDARRAYTRVVFESGEELFFLVQGTLYGVTGPAIFPTDGLPAITPPAHGGWFRSSSNPSPHGAPTLIARPKPAYEVLLREAIMGTTHNFVRVDETLESWRVWEPLISSPPDNVATYADGSKWESPTARKVVKSRQHSADELEGSVVIR